MTHDASRAHRWRVEDDALLRGAGRFVDDDAVPGQAYAAFVRSPHACARIVSVFTQPARAAPGVLDVLTAAELAEAGVGSISRHPSMPGRDGTTLVVPDRPPLAGEQVLHVGHPVAAVIAETAQAAQDAAELIAVEYEVLDPVVDVRRAIEPDAPRVWPQAPGNIALDWLGPADDPEAAEREVTRILETAAHVVRLTTVHQRLVVASMEPRGATGEYEAASGRYTLRACSQGAAPLRDQIAAAMGIENERLRLLTEDVGGAFGMKTAAYPEYPVLLVAAKRIGRPVHWMESRSEAFLSDNQARDAATEAALALDAEGKFLALRARHLANLGAFVTPAGVTLATVNFARCLPTVYAIPRIDVQVRCVFTNTIPTAPYRGAGRPEANYVLERLIDAAARVTGIEPAELRRRNLIPPAAIPYRTPVGTVYDSGDFPRVLEQALALADHDRFAARRAEAKRRGKLRGFGISCFLEHSGGMPTESASLTFVHGERIVLALGVQSTGQGHATVFARLAAERLGIAAAQVTHRHGDTDLAIAGAPAVASRSTMTAGGAVVRAVEAVIQKGRKVASGMLEAAASDIEYRDGCFAVVGTDRRVTLFEVAARAAELAKRGDPAESLDTRLTVDTPQTFPNGCHIAEVEIDPQSGELAVVAYTAVDDCGNALDHTLVSGQVQGAIAQGLGQALLEAARYDAAGELLTGSFMDYAMPRAHHMPPLREALACVPATTNPLGVKGVGEAGTTAAIAALMNAVADAIPGAAGAAIEMPATAEKIWRACRGGWPKAAA